VSDDTKKYRWYKIQLPMFCRERECVERDKVGGTVVSSSECGMVIQRITWSVFLVEQIVKFHFG